MQYVKSSMLSAAFLLVSVVNVFAGEHPKNTWFLPSVTEISVQVDVDAAMSQAGDLSANKRIAYGLASIFESQNIKEVAASGNVYSASVAVEPLGDGNCRYVVRSTFTRPSSFRGKPKLDWAEEGYVRQSCDDPSLDGPIDKLNEHLIALLMARANEVMTQEEDSEELGEQLGEVFACAAGGECKDSPVSDNSVVEAAASESCNSAAGCGSGWTCARPSGAFNGTCVKLTGKDAVSCRFDIDCLGGECRKPIGSLDGVCSYH